MTLQEIASAIRNNVGGGLREVYNHAYSIKQIEDEINNTRNLLIMESSTQGGTLNLEYFMQKMDNLKLDLVRFPYEGYSNSPDRIPHVKIPKLVSTPNNTSLTYFGPPDFSLDFTKYYDSSFNTHRYNRVIGKRPFIFIDLAIDAESNHDVYLFNAEGNNLKEVSVRGMFSDPIALLTMQGIFAEDVEFPAPLEIQEMIIDRITAKYVEYYRKMNQGYQPNTETDTK